MLKRKDNGMQNIESLIGEGVVIKGNINSQGSIRIDGYIEGKLDIKGDFVVGQKGQIKGEVSAENLVLSGKVEGSVICRQRCLINETGVILGDISCSILSIEEGGTLQGASRMNVPNRGEAIGGDKKDRINTGKNKSRELDKAE